MVLPARNNIRRTHLGHPGSPDDVIPIPPFEPEGIVGVRMAPGTMPRRIMVVRLQAFGDTVITLPLLAGLRRLLPDAHVEMVTSAPYADLFESLDLTDVVTRFTSSRSKTARAASVARTAARIGPPDLLIDLQRSGSTRLLKTLLRPPAWVAFDRFAPKAALDRYLEAVRWVGLEKIEPRYDFPIRESRRQRAAELLRAGGYDPHGHERRPLVCLNPAGGWPTKNWPIDSYVRLARRMVEAWNARILLLGTYHVRSGGEKIAAAIGSDAVNLIGMTSTAEAMAVVAHAELMVSDDSGLMHVAWTCGVPTIGILGATRSRWSRPYGPHTSWFGSEDLECGACLKPICARGDIFCLTRVEPEEVFAMGASMRREGRPAP